MCNLFVEAKINEKHNTDYRDWTTIKKFGNKTNNTRGGSLIQCCRELNLGKANPPAMNNSLNETLHCTIPIGNEKLHVFLSYIHPLSKIEENIFRKAAQYKYALLIGDYNCNKRKRKQIQQFLDNSDFTQIKTPPTFIMSNNPPSTPDIVICTNNLKNYIKTKLVPDLGSDHLAIEIMLTLPNQLPRNTEDVHLNLEKCNIEKVNEEMEYFIDTRAPISNKYISDFQSKLTDLINVHTPKITRGHFLHTLPPHIVNQIKKKKQLYRELKVNNDANLKKLYNNLNKEIHKLITEYRSNKWIETCERINEMKGRNYWQEIKKLTRYNPKVKMSQITKNGRTYNTDEEIASAFREYYQETFTPKDNINFDQNFKTKIENLRKTAEKQNNTETVPEITDTEYEEALQGKNTTPGYDNITRKILRQLSPKIHDEIRKIYDYCLSKGYFPVEWKKGIIVTIHKHGTDHNQVSNYRPITLLPIIGKTFEKIVKNRLQNTIGQNIPNHQFGFKENHSTIHPLVALISNIQTTMKKGHKSAALFMDIQKAFDSVWHEGLLYKLHHLDAPIYLQKIIKDFLRGRSIMVKINKYLSLPFTPQQGVPQGSPLSPLLYNIYVYDILEIKHDLESYILQYADDTAIIAHNRNLLEAIKKLQDLCDKIMMWMKKWRILPNPEKSKFILFGHKLSNMSPGINMLQQNIKPTQHVKYLGITLDNKINFKTHSHKKKKEIIARSKHFRSLTYKNRGINTETASKIYKTICRPMLEYGHLLYSNARRPTLNNIEVAERSSLRTLSKIRHPENPLYNPPNTLLYEKTKIEPILSRFRTLGKKFVNNPHNLQILQCNTIQENDSRQHRRKYPTKPLMDVIKDLSETL